MSSGKSWLYVQDRPRRARLALRPESAELSLRHVDHVVASAGDLSLPGGSGLSPCSSQSRRREP